MQIHICICTPHIIRIQYGHHTKLHTHFVAFAFCNVRAEIVRLMQNILCVIKNSEHEQSIAQIEQCVCIDVHYILCHHCTHLPMQQNNIPTTIRMMVNNANATGTTIMIRVHTDKEEEVGPTTKKLDKRQTQIWSLIIKLHTSIKKTKINDCLRANKPHTHTFCWKAIMDYLMKI